MAEAWTLIVVASRYRWPIAPPVWFEQGPTGVIDFPLVKIDHDTQTAWYGVVLL